MFEEDYGWVITRDHTSAEDVQIVHGSYPVSELRSKGTLFKLYDDDGILYYTGFVYKGTGFEPLDDYGMPNAGCTYIEVWEDGEWNIL